MPPSEPTGLTPEPPASHPAPHGASSPGVPLAGSEPYGREGLPLAEALQRIVAALSPLPGSELRPLAACLGRVCAQPVRADAAVPGFRASIMDGYAIAGEAAPAIGQRWQLVGRSAAGAPYNGSLQAGQAVRILTGAVVPAGSGRVLPQELVRLLPREPAGAAGEPTAAEPGSRAEPLPSSQLSQWKGSPDSGAPGRPQGPEAAAGESSATANAAESRATAAAAAPAWIELAAACGANPWIRSPEEECSPGQQLLACGQRLGVAELARLASCGIGQLPVTPRPCIGLLISGDELLPPGQTRGEGQIWESNSLLLTALLQRLGYPVAELRVVADQPEALRSALAELAACCSVVVSTGGISAGDSDWIRSLVAELGEVAFWKLFLKPGRPFAWGRIGTTPFFGLPGNPVAAAITALQLLLPALQRLEGAEPEPLPRLRLRLEAPLQRAPGRPELARARLVTAADGSLWARVQGSQASSRLGSLQEADLLLEIPAEQGDLEAGAELWAQLLRLAIF